MRIVYAANALEVVPVLCYQVRWFTSWHLALTELLQLAISTSARAFTTSKKRPIARAVFYLSSGSTQS